jgi:hypothetical protein
MNTVFKMMVFEVVLLVFLSGCCKQVEQKSSPVLLRLESIGQLQSGSEYFLFTLSNGAPHSISFYEFTPEQEMYGIQIYQGGQWTNVSLTGCCTTLITPITLRTGGTYQMRMRAYYFKVPWRVGFSYWENSPSNTQLLSRETWTGTLSPIARSGAGDAPKTTTN